MIALGVQGVACVMFLIYALVQRTTAIRNEGIAINVKREAEKQADLARKQLELARKEFEECQKNK